MNKQDMGVELVNRYVYAVIQKLPVKQRADIEKELRGLIEDLLDERVQGERVTDRDTEAVLLVLGKPGDLAAKYKGHKRYLISPEMFDIYLAVLKIVLISISIGLSAVFVIKLIVDPMLVAQSFGQYVASLITAAAQGFAWVTLGFALTEYAGVKKSKLGLETRKEWKPADLPEIPDPKNQIKPIEPISGIIFSVLILVVFTFSVDLLGVYSFHEGEAATIVPFFHEDVFLQYLPLMWAVLSIGILRDCFKMIARKWTKKIVAYHVVFNVVSFVLVLVMFSDPAIWNPDFMKEMVQSGLVAAGSEGFQKVNSIWNRSPEVLIAIIALFSIIDTVQVSFKAYRTKR
jgi:hypothetical protein